jgi:hypothetical protein
MAAEKVKERARRAAAALAHGQVPYAIVGGNAVAEFVGRVDEGAVRNTRDVDILIRRADLDAAKTAMTAAGFVYAQTMDVDMFLDGPDARPSEAVHLLFSSELVRATDTIPTPDVAESEAAPDFQVISLAALVVMKLTSFRDKDRTHLRDLIGVGLVDQTWTSRLPRELAPRLQQLLDTPHG